MATMYNEIDIRDILSNQKVSSRFPIISSVKSSRYIPNILNRKTKSGRINKATRLSTRSNDYKLIVLEQIRLQTLRVARPYYALEILGVSDSGSGNPKLIRKGVGLSVTSTRNGDINVNGTLKSTLDFAYYGILRGLSAKGRKALIENMAENAPIMQEIFKQVEIKKPTDLSREQTDEYKVLIRASSVAEISKMNARQIAQLEQDIINSIKFGGGFQGVKKSLGYDTEVFKARSQHERDMWLKKVSKR